MTAQREVDELTRQRDNITSHLAQVRQLLGGQLGVPMPGMDPSPAVTPPPAKPAIADNAPPAVTAAAPAAPAAARQAGNGTATAQGPQPAGNGGAPSAASKADDDENW